MRRLILIAGVLASTAAVAASTACAAARSTVTVRQTAYGRIVVDGRGFALYAFTKDGRGPSRCAGACAAAWPPFIVQATPHAGDGIHRALLGTVRRADGTLQATVGGRPLYYYVGDRSPGQVLCQNVFEFGGDWLVLRASGRLVR